MSDIKWKTPPPSAAGSRGPRGGKWAAIAAALRERPGEWALVAEDVSSSTTDFIKRARVASFAPEGTFEAVTRNTRPNRRVDIYARFVGENGEHR